MTCTEPDCDLPVKARQYCGKHYLRHMKSGKIRKKDPGQRFWSFVDQSGTCWNWTGTHNGRDYGRFSVNDQLVYVHRYSYEVHVGPIPDGMTIDHLCRNRSCVRPDHLEVVTLAENIRRAAAVRPPAEHKLACPQGHRREPLASGRWWCPECNRAAARAVSRRRRARERAERLSKPSVALKVARQRSATANVSTAELGGGPPLSLATAPTPKESP